MCAHGEGSEARECMPMGRRGGQGVCAHGEAGAWRWKSRGRASDAGHRAAGAGAPVSFWECGALVLSATAWGCGAPVLRATAWGCGAPVLHATACGCGAPVLRATAWRCGAPVLCATAWGCKGPRGRHRQGREESSCVAALSRYTFRWLVVGCWAVGSWQLHVPCS